MVNNAKTISLLASSPSTGLTDGTSKIHSGVLKGLESFAYNRMIIEHGGFAIANGGGSLNVMTLTNPFTYIFDGKLTRVTANKTVTAVAAHATHPRYDWVVLNTDDNSLSLIQGTAAATPLVSDFNKAAADFDRYIPVALVYMAGGSAVDAARTFQMYTLDKNSLSLTVADDNASAGTIVEAMSITSTSGDVYFKSKVVDKNIRFILADNTADEKFEIFTDDDSDGDDGDTSIFSVDGAKTLTCGALSYDQEDLLLVSAAAQIQVKDTTNNYAVTIKGGGGPRIQFGDTDSSVDSFMDIGSYGSINNIDTQSRDFKIWGTNSANHFIIDESEGRVGIAIAAPLSTLDVSGNFGTKITTTTATTFTLDDEHTLLGNYGSAAGLAVTLPSASGIAGRIYYVKNINSQGAGIFNTGSETIDGTAYASGGSPLALGQNICIGFQSDGTNWHIISKYTP